MKLTIKRLRERDQYIWNLSGAECKLKINGTTFRPTSKTLGHNLEQAIVKAEDLNKQFDKFKLGLVPTEKYTFKWCIQEFKMSSRWTKEFKDSTKKDYQDTFNWLEKIEKNGSKFVDSNSRKFSKKNVDQLINELIKGRTGTRTDAYTSARNVLIHLKAVMFFLVADPVEYPEAVNPFIDVELKYSGNETYFATVKDLDIAVNQADQLNLRSVGTALTLAYWTMIRVGYIKDLTWSQHYNKTYIDIIQEKNDSWVKFPLYDDGECLYPNLVSRLEKDFTEKKGLYIVMRKQTKNSHGLISGQHYPFTLRYLQEKIRFVLDSCKDRLSNPNLQFSSFRKGAISDLATETNSHNVMSLTGHKSERTLASYINYKDNRKQIKVSKERKGR